MSELDPLTGKDPSSLTVSTLTERLAMERALRENSMGALRELMDERARAIDKALERQATEYERRLETLNGEAGRLAKVLSETVPREVFENFKETWLTRNRAVDEVLAEERGARAGGQRLMAVMLFLIALAGLILRFLPVTT